MVRTASPGGPHLMDRQPVWFLSFQGSPSPHSLSTPKTHLLRDTGEIGQFLAVHSQAAWVSWADRRVGIWVPHCLASQGSPCSCQRWEVGVALAVLGPAEKGGKDGVGGGVPRGLSGASADGLHLQVQYFPTPIEAYGCPQGGCRNKALTQRC